MSAKVEKCIKYINEVGVVSVFPSKNKTPSLFEFLHPRSKFSWDWDDSADSKVVRLWWLKNDIASSKKVLYGKFFSNQPVYLSFKEARKLIKNRTSPNGELEKYIFDTLESNSPLTLRMLKKQAKKDGVHYLRNEWDKAVRSLQKKFLICSFGDSQRENGPMPSTEYALIDLFFDLSN